MKKVFSVVLSFAIMLSFCSCSSISKKERFTKSFLDLFDTASTVIAYDDSAEKFEDSFNRFYTALEEYDHLYSIYNSYEGVVNLKYVNENAMNEPVEVDQKIIDLLKFGKDVYSISGGKTNICFGAVLRLWHEAREYSNDNPADARIPEMADLIEANKHTNIDDLIIDDEKNTVYFTDPDLRLDVGSIAKGYAVNEVCKMAEKELWSSAAISIGGNVYTFGYKNDDGKTLWNIGIENPQPDAEDYLTNVKITELSVVTSGDYQRYFTVNGEKYCHIIDPDTLMPSNFVSSVSVICQDSAMGDALSTTLFSMPIDEGVKMVNGMDGVEAVWVDKDYNVTYSESFQQYIK